MFQNVRFSEEIRICINNIMAFNKGYIILFIYIVDFFRIYLCAINLIFNIEINYNTQS